MDQARSSTSGNSHLRDAFNVGDTSDRKDERLATSLSHLMTEISEGLGMKVIAIMVQRYGVLPKEMWDLNSTSDMGAGRGVTYDEDNVSEAMLENITGSKRFSIINLTIKKASHMVTLPTTLRLLKVSAKEYNYPLDLAHTLNLHEIEFERECSFNQPLVLPNLLRKLKLNSSYNLPIKFPLELVDLELGRAYNHPLVLPQRLKRLEFSWDSEFNLPLALPPSLVSVEFGRSYNQPTTLPFGIEEIGMGAAFTQDLWLPPTLRKIAWWCNCPLLQIPEGVLQIEFGDPFNQFVALPSTLRKVIFYAEIYSHPLEFPQDLEELWWYPSQHQALVLPKGLQNLIWGSPVSIKLPVGLRELKISRNAELVLHEGLLQVELYGLFDDCYYLPESVREVRWTAESKDNVFIHPTTLQHLILASKTHKKIDLSIHRIRKLTIEGRRIEIKNWPQGLKELEFTVDKMKYPVRVPRGCTIVGKKRPENVTME